MLSDLTAGADVRGHRVDVAWTWSGPGARPPFRLVRRRRAYPAGPDDGYPVLDTRLLLRAPDEPWARAVQVRYLAAGSSAEGGLLQAAVTFLHAAPGESPPAAVEIALYAPAPALQRIDGVTAVERTTPAPGPWGSVERLEIRQGAASAGVLTVLRDHSDGITPSRLVWEPGGGPLAQVDFDASETADTSASVEVATTQDFAAAWTRTLRGAEDGRVVLRECFSEDSGSWTARVEVADLGAATEQTAYYRLFAAEGADWSGARGWTARATPTARYGFGDRLYGLLPALHQYYDEPAPDDRGQGQLRRFMQLFGVGLDHLRSEGESLRSRHDVADAREDLLPALGSWIAWPTDRTAPLAVQRGEIRMAPDVYETVGTLPNIVALATRATGWPCEAKEFVHNLFMTNAPESVPVRELWELAHDGTAFGAPVRLTSTESFDGRPAAVDAPGGGTWLFWHSNRSGRWELWTRAPGGEPEPLEPAADAYWSDLAPAAVRRGGDVWLVWESDRAGTWDIWARVHDGTAWGPPFQLTHHRAADRRPAVALGPGGTLWAFWESDRRGRSEIWSRSFDATVWTPAVRVTEGLGADREPTAALDAAGVLRLAWRRNEGDRSRLYTRAFEAGAWGPIGPLEDGPWRDEAPALARRGGELWLLWHSDRTGRWELWARVHDAAGWGEPRQVTLSPDPDKEPALLVDGSSLRVFWRSERIAQEYRSRTVDTSDVEALEQLGRLRDRLHYTYDAAREDEDWYARDVAGLYVTPPPGTPATVVEDVLERARTYLEPFCPATVRLVLIPTRAAESADFFTDGIEADEPIVDEFEDEIE